MNAVNKRCTEKMFKVNKNLEFSPLHERDNNINNIPVSNNNNDNDNDNDTGTCHTAQSKRDVTDKLKIVLNNALT